MAPNSSASSLMFLFLHSSNIILFCLFPILEPWVRLFPRQNCLACPNLLLPCQIYQQMHSQRCNIFHFQCPKWLLSDNSYFVLTIALSFDGLSLRILVIYEKDGKRWEVLTIIFWENQKARCLFLRGRQFYRVFLQVMTSAFCIQIIQTKSNLY